MSRNRMSFVWTTALAYPAMMAALWLSTSHSYQDAHLIMRDRWWFIAGIASVTLAMAKLSGTKINHSRRLGGISWLLIVCVAIVVVGGVQTIHEPGTDSQVAAATILGTFFVGIGEEVAYRGIVFNLLAQRYSIIKTVIASSLLFGLLHSVNVIVQDAQMTISQVVITTILGTTFAWSYVSSRGNLLLVISLHWLYDAFLLAPKASAAGVNPNAGVAFLLFATAVIMFIHGAIRYRGHMWSEVLTT